jgi:phage terminase large subunit
LTTANRNIVRTIIPPGSGDDEVEFFDVPSVGDDYFRKMPDNPIVQAENFVKTYREKPLRFIKYELGVPVDIWKDDVPPANKKILRNQLPLWSKQREIVTALIKHRKVTVKSGHGIGKCPSIDNMILLANGDLVKAKNLIGKTFRILSYKDGKQTIQNAIAEDNGIRDCKRITYEDGNIEIVTENHPLWTGIKEPWIGKNGQPRKTRFRGKPLITEKGFVDADKLNAGDYIASPSYLDIEGKETLSDDEVKFLGYMIGDGGISTGGVNFTQEDNAQLAELREIVTEAGCELKAYSAKYQYRITGDGSRKTGSNNLLNLLYKLNLIGTNSHTKFVPKEVLCSTKRQITLFLSRLYSTDGWITGRVCDSKGRYQVQIGYTSASRTLAEQVYYLLKRLGIHANIDGGIKERIKVNGVGKQCEAWTVNILGYKSQCLFNEIIKIYGKEDKQNEVMARRKEAVDARKLFNYREKGIIPGFYWNKIVKIEDLQYPTVIIEVEDTNTFITPYSYEHNSFIAGISALTLHYAWHALGITTAPTFRQVRRVLWGEIHNLYNNAPRKLGGNLYQTSLESGDKWFIEGMSVKDPTSAFAGFHEENIFIIIDEAGGVSQEVFDTMEGILTSENSFVLLIGNPLDSASAFADSFKPGSPYHQITMSCYDSPNVKNGRNIYPKLVTYDWPERMKAKWGVDSNLFRVRVLGEFPAEGKDTLIPVKYIDLAVDTLKTYFEAVQNSKEESLISIGADIARLGEDSTVIGARWRNKLGMERFEVLGDYSKQRTDETTDRITEWYHLLVRPGERPVINIDDIGLGGGVVDNLLRKEYPVNPINVGETPDTFIENDEKFLNKRAQYYWNLRNLFVDQKVGMEDDGLAHELSKIGLDFGGSGKERIKIEPKDKTRKKLQGKSPDKADCMMLAFAEEEELSSQRWIF